jgi:hypothetical protein
MISRNHWIVCENAGRWSAALRVAISRQATKLGTSTGSPRIDVVRTLAELDSAMREQNRSLALVEVRSDNLAAVLELLAKSWRRNVRLAALLDSELGLQPSAGSSQSPDRPFAADALLEAGALAVIDSPRQIPMLLNLAERQTLAEGRVADSADTNDSLTAIVDRAWAALPWQDA